MSLDLDKKIKIKLLRLLVGMRLIFLVNISWTCATAKPPA